jgi:hypothetical protein
VHIDDALTATVHGDHRDAARQHDWSVGLNGSTEDTWPQPECKQDSPVGTATEAHYDSWPDHLDLRAEEARTTVAEPLWGHSSLHALGFEAENGTGEKDVSAPGDHSLSIDEEAT